MGNYDVIIIGGGPAGLTAAIYTSRARLKTLLLESFTVPGQAVITSDIENYPAFPEGINGFDIIDKMKKQAKKFGTEISAKDVKAIKEDRKNAKGFFIMETEGESFASECVIVATGARPKKLGIPGENEFRGKGVSYCATCDGAFFKDKNIVVVGGGDTAIEESIFLTRFVRKITIIHRRDRLRATKILEERALVNKKIEFALNSEATEIAGTEKVESVRIRNVKTEKSSVIPCEGVFMFVGYEPNTSFVKGVVNLDQNGYIITDDNMKTSKEGIFAAGDVRKKLLRQVITACGDGAVAARSARMYIDELRGTVYK